MQSISWAACLHWLRHSQCLQWSWKTCGAEADEERHLLRGGIQPTRQTWEVSPGLFENIQRFTCHMYSAAASTSKVNELRYQLFCCKRGEIESSQLPPCRDCLYMHTMRANFQSGVWRRCLESQPHVPNPEGRGWKKDQDGTLTIEWMRTSPAPVAVTELLSCKCARECRAHLYLPATWTRLYRYV